MSWTFGINVESSSTGGGVAQAVRIEGAAFPGGPFPCPPWLSGPPERDRQGRGGLPAGGRGRGRALPRAPARGLGVMLPESGGERSGPPFPGSVTVSGQGVGLGVQSHSASCLEKREGHCRQALVSRGDSARRVMGSALPCRLFSPRASCPGAQPPGPGSGGGAVRGQSPALTNEC